MHRGVVLRYVASSLRSSCEAGSSEWHPEMIHSFLLFQCIPISVNFYMNSMFPACFLCGRVAFELLWAPIGLYGSTSVHSSRNTHPKKMEPCRNFVVWCLWTDSLSVCCFINISTILSCKSWKLNQWLLIHCLMPPDCWFDHVDVISAPFLLKLSVLWDPHCHIWNL